MSSHTDYDISHPKNALKTTGVVLAIAVLAGIANIMSSDFEFASMLQNPLIYERADVVDTYTYRSGLMQMNLASHPPLWAVKIYNRAYSLRTGRGRSIRNCLNPLKKASL